MKTAEEILDEHCIELREEFLTTAKWRKFKLKVLAAMEAYKGIVSLVELEENGLIIEEIGYYASKLYKGGEYLMEGSREDCHKRAREIISKT